MRQLDLQLIAYLDERLRSIIAQLPPGKRFEALQEHEARVKELSAKINLDENLKPRPRGGRTWTDDQKLAQGEKRRLRHAEQRARFFYYVSFAEDWSQSSSFITELGVATIEDLGLLLNQKPGTIKNSLSREGGQFLRGVGTCVARIKKLPLEKAADDLLIFESITDRKLRLADLFNFVLGKKKSPWAMKKNLEEQERLDKLCRDAISDKSGAAALEKLGRRQKTSPEFTSKAKTR